MTTTARPHRANVFYVGGVDEELDASIKRGYEDNLVDSFAVGGKTRELLFAFDTLVQCHYFMAHASALSLRGPRHLLVRHCIVEGKT